MEDGHQPEHSSERSGVWWRAKTASNQVEGTETASEERTADRHR